MKDEEGGPEKDLQWFADTPAKPSAPTTSAAGQGLTKRSATENLKSNRTRVVKLSAVHLQSCSSQAGPRYPGLILQPDSSPISQDQLAAEVKGIYAGLVMEEAKCFSIDEAVTASSSLGQEHWQALIALHRTLLYEHPDFLMAIQHPSATPALRGLATKYSMPARMRKHGIYAFLEVLRYRRPDSHEYMLSFISLAYQMMALLYETRPDFQDTWIECLGDIARYRMAIDEEWTHARWGVVAASLYTKAADGHPRVGRLYHHLGILERPSRHQFACYAKSPMSAIPSPNARDSLAARRNPIPTVEGTDPDSHLQRHCDEQYGLLSNQDSWGEQHELLGDTVPQSTQVGLLTMPKGMISSKLETRVSPEPYLMQGLLGASLDNVPRRFGGEIDVSMRRMEPAAIGKTRTLRGLWCILNLGPKDGDVVLRPTREPDGNDKKSTRHSVPASHDNFSTPQHTLLTRCTLDSSPDGLTSPTSHNDALAIQASECSADKPRQRPCSAKSNMFSGLTRRLKTCTRLLASVAAIHIAQCLPVAAAQMLEDHEQASVWSAMLSKVKWAPVGILCAGVLLILRIWWAPVKQLREPLRSQNLGLSSACLWWLFQGLPSISDDVKSAVFCFWASCWFVYIATIGRLMRDTKARNQYFSGLTLGGVIITAVFALITTSPSTDSGDSSSAPSGTMKQAVVYGPVVFSGFSWGLYVLLRPSKQDRDEDDTGHAQRPHDNAIALPRYNTESRNLWLHEAYHRGVDQYGPAPDLATAAGLVNPWESEPARGGRYGSRWYGAFKQRLNHLL